MLGWIVKPLAVACTVGFSTLGILAQRYRKARLYFRAGIYVTCLGALSAWGACIGCILPFFGQRLNIQYYVARPFYWLCGNLIGIKFDVEGEEHLLGLASARDGKSQSAMLISNHQSMLDVLLVGRILPKKATIMAKSELKFAPILGQWMMLSGVVFIDRKNRQGSLQTLEKASNDMKSKGMSIWVFPEGTRSSAAESKLLPFKKGAFNLAVQAQVPIIPIVCENYHRLFDSRTRFESGILRIKVLPPISTIGLTRDDVNELAETTRDQMLKTLQEISDPNYIAGRLSGEEDVKEEEGSLPLDNSKDLHLRITSSRGESTGDEMDGDAVLLKHP